MTLTFQNLVRVENDAQAIQTLKRKGWVENNPPSFDQETENPPEWNGVSWIKTNKSPEQTLSEKRGLVCTPRQIRLWLNNHNLLSSVEAAVDSADEVTKIEWKYAIEFRRDHPMLQSIGSALGLSSSDMDSLFKEASVL